MKLILMGTLIGLLSNYGRGYLKRCQRHVVTEYFLFMSYSIVLEYHDSNT